MNRLLCSVVLVAVACSTVRADEDDEFRRLAPLTSAETVFVGKIAKVTKGPVGLSNPPVHTFRFEFEAGELLRGTAPGKGVFGYSIRTNAAPGFDTDARYVVGLNKDAVVAILPAGQADIERAKELTALPAGWAIRGGKPVSPWTAAGDKAWPKDGPKSSDARCATTGRPALLCGTGIEWKVEQVPAKNPMKFRNDMYGDGRFKVTLTNATKGVATVAAVVTEGKGGILWADSVLLMVKGKPHVFPGGGKVTAESKPLVLKAGESVTAELDTLAVDGIEWPRGGQRVYFDFLLGEKSANNFFYYFSAVHDPMREAAVKQAGGK